MDIYPVRSLLYECMNFSVLAKYRNNGQNVPEAHNLNFDSVQQVHTAAAMSQ